MLPERQAARLEWRGEGMANKIRVAIVEDNPSDRELLVKHLRRFEAEKALHFELIGFSDGEDLVTDYSADYDLILMDIEMTFMNGMRAAKRVRELDPDVVIVFVTNAPQYAIEGYKVRAVDYMLKPVTWFSFSECLSRALLYVKDRGGESITVALKDGKTRLPVDRICYVEVQDHQLIYNTRDGRFVTKGTIRDVEEQLGPPRFCRCNRCYIVNLEFVETYRGSDLVVNGDTLQISRRQRKGFLDALNLYINGDGR